jgi:hypothetical protein
MDTPAFNATRLIRPVLRFIVFCFSGLAQRSVKTLIFSCAYALILCVLLGSTAKSAHATGNVATVFISCSSYVFQNAHSGYEQGGYATAAAACGSAGVGLGAYAGNGNYYCASSNEHRALCMAPVYSCPANSTGTPATNPTSCTCDDPYVPDTTQTSCILPACPDHASRTTPGAACTCDANYKFDAAGTSCVPAATCPVDKLTTPPFNDACAEVLENISSTQAQKDAACGALTDKLKADVACFSEKLSRTNDPVTGSPIPLVITADIRDTAYQAHLREIWDKMERLVALEDDPVKKNACAGRRVEIAAEKGCDNAGVCTSCYSESATQRSHCIKGRPALPNPNDAQHTQGNAIDVSATYTIAPLNKALKARHPPQTIPQFLDAPTNCNLIWGGTFNTNKDPVHFLAR